MPNKISESELAERRASVLQAARWCFLNFGFAKTSFEEIAQRAHLSRTLLYRLFNDKEDIFSAVFADWLTSRHPAALLAATGPGNQHDRLLNVCRLMVLEPWVDMVGAPMGAEFFDVCERLDPAIEAQHRSVALDCVAKIIGSAEIAEIFLLAMEGLLTDQPTPKVLEQRTQILAARFVQDDKR